jgi:hypothetical protein
MKSIYDLEETGDKHGFLIFFLKYLLVLAALLLVGGGCFFFWFFNGLFKNWDDANIVCPINSKDSWRYFAENVCSETSNINNVKAEDHSNIRQREYKITFETDSGRLFRIIAQKQLPKDTAHPNLYHLDYSRTFQSISFDKKAGGKIFHVEYFLQDHALIHTCDTVHGRCFDDVCNTFNQFGESFLAAYKNKLNPRNFIPYGYSNKISYISFFIFPSGKVRNATIKDQWNKFDEEFKKCYLAEVNKIDFGKKNRADSLDCQFPIQFISLEPWAAPGSR